MSTGNEKLRVELGDRSYDISIAGGSLDGIGEAVRSLGPSPRAALISNPTVHALYGVRVRDSLSGAGLDVTEIIIPDGEEYKSLLWTEQALAALLRARLDRKSVVVALGGGVIGDLAGFAASVYMRGIRFVQVPTTLLAQVDSSVGGKTGVNHELGKNMIGSFWQPSLVWIDLDTLKTLPAREFRAGMAEVIKYGIIWDAGFFRYLIEKRKAILSLDVEALSRIIFRSCDIKAEVVARDERESGLRAILNLGHTIGHAVETATGYSSLLHGEAVAIGMHIEALLSERLGIVGNQDVAMIREILEMYDLPCNLPDGLSSSALIEAMELDKKAVAGEIRFTLPEKIGSSRINVPVRRDDIEAVLVG